MTAKNPLSKLRSRQGSGSSISSTNFSFRFNPAEEDLLEEYTASETSPSVTPTNTKNEILRPGNSGTGEGNDDDQASSCNVSASSSLSEGGSHTPLSEKSSRDASPLKETKEYFPKVGKRSSSLDSSSDGERWFSGIKGRIVRKIEEIGKDPPAFAGSLYKGEKQKLKESFSSNGVTETITEHSIADVQISKSFTSRSRSSLDVRAGIEDEVGALTPVTKERDRSISVEEGIDCTTEVNAQNQLESLVSESKSNLEQTKESSQTNKRSTVNLVTSGAQALLSRNRSPKLSSKVLTSQSSLPTEYTLSSLKSTPSFESELLPAEEIDDFATWEFVNSAVALEEKPETPLVFEKPVTKYSKFQPCIKEPKNLFIKLWQPLKTYLPVKKYNQKLKHGHKNRFLGVMVLFIALHVSPISSYWVGLLSGFLLSYIVGSILWLIFQPSPSKKPLEIPDYQNLPPLKIPTNDDDKETFISKGWMNELLNSDYDPENYHVNLTQSVYVRLEGIQLRLSRPKVNIPKRAMWNEPKINTMFVNQRHFNIKGAKVSIPPEGLVRKRLWSKKYPICVVIPSEQNTLGSTSSWPVIHTSVEDDESHIQATSSEDEKSTKTCSTTTLYLFARTCREKEEWFRKFQAAALGKSLVQFQKDYCQCVLKNLPIVDNLSNPVDNIENKFIDRVDSTQGPGDYLTFMARFISQEQVAQNVSNIRSSVTSSNSDGEKPTFAKEISTSDLWLNALIGRIFYDFLTHNVWSKVISEKIQKKLSVIKLPYFMEELKLRDIDLGGNLPFLHRYSPPMLDERGLWIDFDLTYKGSFQMTLETKLNLMRLKKDSSMDKGPLSLTTDCPEDFDGELSPPLYSSKSFYNSDEEDSAESSSDEDISFAEAAEHTTDDSSPSVPSSPSLSSALNKASTSKKFLHWVDKITQSRYFQQATEIGYIKKAMAGVSKTPIVLTVEVKGLVGTLALNVPPPPSDRLWYGFRGNPQLILTARPKLGEHVVTITHVTDWIEKKLRLEFQKLLVMPNMDDLIIPIMESGLVSQQMKDGQS